MHSVSGRHPTFPEGTHIFFIISDLYRVLPEFAEVHTDIARSIFLFHLTPVTLKFTYTRSNITVLVFVFCEILFSSF